MFNPFNVPVLNETSPWASLANWALPNIKWCEATHHHGWITEPANTWSNLAYFLVAWLIYAHFRSSRRTVSLYFTLATVNVGFWSFVYHASYSFVFQIFDFIAMYVYVFLLIFLNLRRLNHALGTGLFFWCGVASLTAATIVGYFLRMKFQALVLLAIISALALEYAVSARLRRNHESRKFSLTNLFLGMSFLFVGAIFSALDVTRAICFPEHPALQGHAIWHCLTAVSLYYAHRHYSQFAVLQT